MPVDALILKNRELMVPGVLEKLRPYFFFSA
jgi:hypothetical protein